ncbi:heterokaryon incompatibility protein-domain-containing protein [Nemania sp. FL0916]|nr:heterokaryon incompatibility protein-domain-containing protein [Nemania sp. FL0916]
MGPNQPAKPSPGDIRIHARRTKGRLCESLIQSPLGGKFLPQREIIRVVARLNLEQLLPEAPKDLIDFIQTRASQVFSLSIRTLDLRGDDLEELARSFQLYITKDGSCSDPEGKFFCNSTDPAKANSGCCKHPPALNVFHTDLWGSTNFEKFLENQHSFFVPILEIGNLHQFNTELPNGTIMPFIWRDDKPRSGHFSTVSEVLLHAECQKNSDQAQICSCSKPPIQVKHVHAALKEFRKHPDEVTEGYDVNATFNLEVTTLGKLEGLNHDHLIRPMSAFKLDGNHYILLEWANGGTLRDFWIHNRDAHLQLNGKRIIEALTQLRGIIKALSTLHETKRHTKTDPLRNGIDIPSATTNMPAINLPSQNGYGDISDATHWRHGDLKPENLLVFKNSSWLGVLKIADLGLAKQHEFDTIFRPDPTSTKFTTWHYEAPEAETNTTGPRTRRYDVWSMGCIMLEFVIWLLHGYSGLQEFYDLKPPNHSYPRHTLYFMTQPGNDNNDSIATVNSIATYWINHMLDNDPECKQRTALRDLLLLVRDRLLVVDVSRRAPASEMLERMEKIADTAKTNKNYLFTGASRSKIEVPSFPNMNAPQQEAPHHQSHLQVGNPQARRSPQVSMLNTTWELITDDTVSTRLMNEAAFRISPDNSASLCTDCCALNLKGSDSISSNIVRVNFSSLDKKTEVCALCTLFLHICNISNPSIATHSIQLWRVNGGLSLDGLGEPVLSIYGIDFAKARSDPRAGYIRVGLPKLAATASKAHFSLLRQWLDDCDKHHKRCLPDETRPQPVETPTRLIDVGENDSPNVHLVDTHENHLNQTPSTKYIALSHPWGNKDSHDHYCTTQLNLSSHKNMIRIDILPNTIQDAIRVARELSIQYLWVDSLCIVQGEGGDFDREAKYMEAIFSSAYCVIAATCASGMSDGFLKDRPDRKIVKFERAGEAPLYICELFDDFQGDVLEGSLNRRGWVLQERALARRTIYFAESQTYWECGEGVCCETWTRMKNNQAEFLGDANFPKVATESPKGGQIRLYELLYKQYSRLQFTNICDRPLAIAGIEQRLIRAFNSQGGYGVFTRYFHRGLLWQRDTTLTSETMRPIPFPASQPYQVPSWSWMAYEGAIDFMELPFRKVDWEEDEVRSPWDPPSLGGSSSYLNLTGNTMWHTAETGGETRLTVIARDFFPTADIHIIYDGGRRPKDHIIKCVTVGRSKLDMKDNVEQTYYVLIIGRRGTRGDYKRIGVGPLPKSMIYFKDAKKVQVS